MSKRIWSTFLFGSVFVLSSVATLAAEGKTVTPNESDPSLAIIGGTEATPGEFPYVVSIERKTGKGWSHSCAGVIYNECTIVTAAHCLDGVPAGNLRVVAGSHCHDDLQATQVSGVALSKPHPDYEKGPGTYPNDIALVKLREKLEMIPGAIERAQFATQWMESDPAKIVGWGRTSCSSISPNCLQKADTGVLPNADAIAKLTGVSGAVFDPASQMAVYDQSAQITFCNGDDGGPVLVRGEVAGIMSWEISTNSCCLPAYPAVASRVSYFLPWINNTATTSAWSCR